MNEQLKKSTRREFLDGAIKTTIAASTISALGQESAAQAKPFVIKTEHGNLEIGSNPFSIKLKDKQNKTILQSAVAARRSGIGNGGSFDEISNVSARKENNGFEFEAAAGGRRVTVKLSGLPNSILLEAEANGGESIALAFEYAADEFLSGAGQRIRSLNLRGCNINSVARVNDEGLVKVGSNDEEFSAPMPFFLSNRGYGIYLETEGLWNFDFGKAEAGIISLLCAGTKFRLHLITGTTPKEIVRKYTNLTGRMHPTADWNFGLWKWRDVYRDELEVYEDASMMQSMDLPATAMIIDSPWSSKHVSFDFNPNQYPNGKQMLANLKKMGYKAVFWLVPFINPNAENFKFADERGYFVKDPAGRTMLVDWWNPTGSPELGLGTERLAGMIDFTFTEATAWWQAQVGKMVEAGVDGWKLDDGEFLPLNARMHDGRTGDEVKSAYAAMYHKAVFEVMLAKKPGEFSIMPRAAAAGAQKYMTAFWAGDQNADFNPQLGLPSVIIGAQTMGLMGYPIWTSDTGGYRQAPKPRVFARWTQFSAFCPLMIVGGKSYREPWHFSDEIESIFRRYVQLHAALLPYIKTSVQEAYTDGTPVIRPLFLEFPADKAAYEQDFQYMFGNSLMVAPVYTEDDFRTVYFPAGRWMDFDTLEIHQGPKTVARFTSPLERIPVFVRVSSEVSKKLYEPLLKKQWDGLIGRCGYYLQIRGKILRPQPFDRMKKQVDAFAKTEFGDPAGRLKAIADLTAFIDREEAESSMPYFTAKNLRERLKDIGLSLRATKKLDGIKK